MEKLKRLFADIRVSCVIISVVGALIQAVGIYQIHSVSDITEGGVLGLTLLLQYWIHLSPAISSIVLTGICYLIGWRALGKNFVIYSAVSAGSFALFYAMCEWFTPRVWPTIGEYPWAASVLGALFIGVGAGLCVRAGGATTGDDALAMSLSHTFRFKIQWVYLVSDLVVLGASLSYIPPRRIVYSLLTVVLSGQIIGLISDDENRIRKLFHKRTKEGASETNP